MSCDRLCPADPDSCSDGAPRWSPADWRPGCYKMLRRAHAMNQSVGRTGFSASESWRLAPEGAAIHLGERTAVIADVHLGYEWARGSAGDCVPAYSLDETLSRLTTARPGDDLAPVRGRRPGRVSPSLPSYRRRRVRAPRLARRAWRGAACPGREPRPNSLPASRAPLPKHYSLQEPANML